MKISKQNMVISLAGGVIAFSISAPVIEEFSLFIGPAVAAMLWAHYSKKDSVDN